jgi:2-phospho-L-lactate guanylyltransferase
MILVPVKNLATAKQRLASILDQAARTSLAQAMLEDVLSALHAWRERPPVAVVTSDPFASSLARRLSFHVIEDHQNRSETDAIEMATRVCQAQGAESTLVIPGDIPLVKAWELQQVLQAAPLRGTVLVPAGDGRGTNAAWRKPAGLFPLRFGNDSFQPHLEAARSTGQPCVVLQLAGVALDVDRPEDLVQLTAAPGDTRAQRLAREWVILEKIPAAS